jgi:hypothetical protein
LIKLDSALNVLVRVRLAAGRARATSALRIRRFLVACLSCKLSFRSNITSSIDLQMLRDVILIPRQEGEDEEQARTRKLYSQ